MFSPSTELAFLPAPVSDHISTERLAELTVVPIAELAVEDRGWTRGHAHLGFDDHPKGAPGHLDFFPVKLAALQSIDAGKGYAMHPHANIETILLVLDGTMSHEDSLGNRASVEASGVAVLSAGRGIEHSEFAEGSDLARAVLFWVEPNVVGTEPRFHSASFPKAERVNRFVPLASGRANQPSGVLPVLRDVTLFAAHVTPGAVVRQRLESARRGYLVATDAPVTVNGRRVEAGERVLVRGPGWVEVQAHDETEVVLLDVD